MAEINDFDALFNPQVEVSEPSKKNAEDYMPTAEKGIGKVYKSIIRFVPWWENPKKSIIEKWTCWLVDPVTKSGRVIDCPTSVGKPSILQDMFFKLYKSDNVREKEQSKIFSRRHTFISLVQIIKDENDPTLEGKILAWKFGKKIYDKIMAEKKPAYGVDPHEPYDPINGKLFLLHINIVSEYNNYDSSKFLDKRVGICMKDKEGKLIPITAQTDKQTFFEFLKTNSPDLKKYEFKEWDTETHGFVNTVISAVTGKNAVPTNTANVLNATNTPTMQVPVKSETGITVKDIGIESLGALNNIGELSNIDLGSGPSGIGGITGNLDDVLKGL
jgi:hypothetical protein